MSEQGRYGEPWFLATGCSWRRILTKHADEPCIVPVNHPIDNHPDLAGGEDKLNRAVACVNACEGAPSGIQPGAVKAMAMALEHALGLLPPMDDADDYEKASEKMINEALRLYYGDESCIQCAKSARFFWPFLTGALGNIRGTFAKTRTAAPIG